MESCSQPVFRLQERPLRAALLEWELRLLAPESTARLKAVSVSRREAEAQPQAWPLEEALPAEPAPLPLPSFV